MIAQNMVKAVGYARRSTDMQERSIPDQQAFVHRWAEEHGYTILRWFTDDAISGTSTKGREAFERMIYEAENGRGFDAVLVYDISRFSRGGSTEMGFFLYRLQQAGVRVIFCAEALPEDDGGELLLGVKSWQARQYSVKLSRDCIRGAVSSIRVKHSAPGGRAPYGYDKQHLTPDGQALRTLRYLADGRKEELDPAGRHVRFIPGPESVGKVKSDIIRLVRGLAEQVKAVRMIYERCCQGYGFRSILIELNGLGIPSPAGAAWTTTQVKNVLNNPCYKGAIAYNRRTQGIIHSISVDGRAVPKKDRRKGWNPRDQWIVVEGVHEPLVLKETWEKAQSEMNGRREQKGLARPTKRYLLSGLLICRHCGLNFWGAVLKRYDKGTDCRYYVDAGYRSKGLAVCKSTSIHAEPLERWVLGKVRQVILGDAEATQAAVDTFVKAVLAKRKAGVDTAAVEKEQAVVNRRIKMAIAVLADAELGDLEELKATLVDLKRRRAALEAKRAEGGTAAGEGVDETSLRKWALEKLSQVDEALDGKLPPLETRRLVHAYVDRIEVDPYKYTGVMYIPADARAFLSAERIRRVNVGSPKSPSAILPSVINMKISLQTLDQGPSASPRTWPSRRSPYRGRRPFPARLLARTQATRADRPRPGSPGPSVRVAQGPSASAPPHLDLSLQKTLSLVPKSLTLNTLGFVYVFNKALEGLFIDRMEQNEKITAEFMNGKDFRRVVTEGLLRHVYDQIRSRQAAG